MLLTEAAKAILSQGDSNIYSNHSLISLVPFLESLGSLIQSNLSERQDFAQASFLSLAIQSKKTVNKAFADRAKRNGEQLYAARNRCLSAEQE
jgi:hypothetical protein